MGELLDHSFRLYRKHFLTFLAMTAVVYIPVNLLVQFLSAYLQGSALSLGSNAGALTRQQINEQIITLFVSLAALLALALLANLILYVSQGALTASVADSHLDKPVSFSSGYRQMWARVGPLVGAIMIQALVAVGLFLPVIALYLFSLFSLGGDSSGGALGIMCLAVLVAIPATLYYIYLFIRWSLVVPVIMVEGRGAREGLKRSGELVQNYWWRTLGLIALLAILSSIIAGGPAAVFTFIALLLMRTFDPVILSLVSGVITVLISTIFVPLQLIAMTLYYFDLRVRKEGFDLETAMAQRYWPQYGSPYGYPPVGWATGPEQYGSPQGYGQQGTPTTRVMAPPVLGQGSGGQDQGYDNGYGYGYPPGYAEPQAEAPTVQEPDEQAVEERPSEPDEVVADTGTPTIAIAPDDIGAERDTTYSTSPTPDWLAPPVLGSIPDTGPLGSDSHVREGSDAEEEEHTRGGQGAT